MKEKEKGVTLIELVIVFVLIIIITGMVRLNSGRYGKFLVAEREAIKLSQGIKETLDKAKGIERLPDDLLPDGISSSDYAEGRYLTIYGIKLVKGESQYYKTVYLIDRLDDKGKLVNLSEEDVLAKIKTEEGMIILETVSIEGEINELEHSSFDIEVIVYGRLMGLSISDSDRAFIVFTPSNQTHLYGEIDLGDLMIVDVDYIDIHISSKDKEDRRAVHVTEIGQIILK